MWWPIGGHRPLSHNMITLTHHAHGILLALVMLCTATSGRDVVLLGGCLLVHYGPLVGLHVNVGARAVSAYGLSLAYIHLTL